MTNIIGHNYTGPVGAGRRTGWRRAKTTSAIIISSAITISSAVTILSAITIPAQPAQVGGRVGAERALHLRQRGVAIRAPANGRLNSYGLNNYGLHSYGVAIRAPANGRLNSYGLNSYGLHSYGVAIRAPANGRVHVRGHRRTAITI